MTLERIIPEDLPTAETYSHAIAATSRRLVFVAGQIAEGPDGTLVCDDPLPAIEAARASLFGEHKPVDALVGLERLTHAGCLIEVDAIAVADD